MATSNTTPAAKDKDSSTARVKRKDRTNITSGVAHVNATFNNTIVTITDAQGNTIAWSSSGAQGFKGSRKSTPYAAQMASEMAARAAAEHGGGAAEEHAGCCGHGAVLCERCARASRLCGRLVATPSPERRAGRGK